MALGDNAIIPLFEPGRRPTVAVTGGAISAGKFVVAATGFQGGPLLNVSTPITGGNVAQVALAGAGVKAWGVLGYDTTAVGDTAPLIAGSDMIVPMNAGATITAGQEVEGNASGDPIPLASGKANGYAISGATSGNTVYIRLY